MPPRLIKWAASFHGGLIFITAAGFAIRAATSPWKIYHPDSGLYLLLARRIAQGHLDLPMGADTGYYQPLFSAATALFGVFFRDLEIAGCLVSVTTGSAAVLIAGMMARRQFGATAGLIAAAIVAFHPGLVHYGGVALTESIYIFFISAAIFAAWSALKNRGYVKWLIAGLLFGLAYLARVAGFFLAGVPLIYIIATIRPRNESAKSAAAFLIGLCILALPYIGYLRVNQGAWRLTGQQGQMFYIFIHRGDVSGSEGKIDPATGRIKSMEIADRIGAFETMRESLGFIVVRGIKNLKQVCLDLGKVFPIFFSAAIGLGLAGVFRGRPEDKREAVYIFSFWIPAIALQTFTGTSPRYYIPLVPLGAIIAGGGMAWFLSRAGKKIGYAAMALLSISLLANIRYAPDPDAKWVDIQRDVGHWIAKYSTGRQIKVMTREPYIAYFAGGERIAVPNEPIDAVLDYARKVNVDFIIVDSVLVRSYQPQFEPLLNPANAPSDFKPVVSWSREQDRIIYVYERKQKNAIVGGDTSIQ